MNVRFTLKWSRILGASAGLGILGLVVGTTLYGQGQLTQPVYRVANDTTPAATSPSPPASVPASPMPTTPATPPVPEGPAWPGDVTQRPGEHPLAPAIRACKASLEHLDKNITDYSCTLAKRERLQGEPAVGEPQYILMKVRHEPFTVYMSFLKPHAGREVLYPAARDKNELIVREAGFIGGIAGKLNLHPESTMAMNGQKYPIYKVGIRNLLGELIRNFEADTKFAESEVTINPKTEYNKRPTTLIQVTHPVPRQNFRSHISRVYFDNELRVPIYYDAYMWPEKEGQGPPLEESYSYTNLKVNNGYTARDFDAEGGVIFK
jgi:hypothetical protein